jgi:hypothetical protein
MRRVAVLLLVLAMVNFGTGPAAAVGGIYCSSYTYSGPSGGMICFTTCVYCEDRDNGNVTVARVCYDEVCWFGGREPV